MLGRRSRVWSAVLVIIVAAATLAACGGGGSPSSKSPSSSVAQSASSAGPANVSQDAISGGAVGVSSAATGAPATSGPDWGQKIIRNADITLQVTSVESMLATIRTITDSAGGVVFASSSSYDGDQQIASMTLDVPQEQFDQVITQLRSAAGVKKVEKETVSSQDVTEQYVDLQSQLRNLQATQARLQQLMGQATQLQDVLTIQQQLSNVEGQIEQTTGRINYLDKHTSFSRITISLVPVGVAVNTKPKSGTDLGQAVHDAWKSSLAFTGGVLTVLVKTTVFLWWFWPLALVTGLVFLARRQRRRPVERGPEVPV